MIFIGLDLFIDRIGGNIDLEKLYSSSWITQISVTGEIQSNL